MERQPIRARKLHPRLTPNFLDTCAFDPKYYPENIASHEIDRISREEILFSLILTHSNKKEIDHPNTPVDVKRRAEKLLYTLEVSYSPEETTVKRLILECITGNGNVEKYRADAEHVFIASRMGGYFITTDQRILSKRNELKAIRHSLTVIKPSEWLSIFKEPV